MAAIVAERTPLPDSTEPIPAPLVPDDVCRALDESQTRLGEGLSILTANSAVYLSLPTQTTIH